MVRDLDTRLKQVTRLERAHNEARRELDAAIATATCRRRSHGAKGGLS